MKNIKFISSILVLLLISCDLNEKSIEKEGKKNNLSTLNKDGTLVSEIKVIGEVKNPLILTVDTLKKMNVFHGGLHQLVCRSGENRKRINSFKGVLLKEILNKANIIYSHKESGSYVVKITSSNNYVVTYSLNELLYNETGNNVFLIFEENEKEIRKDGGLMSVITLNDSVTGVRHVKWPSEIKVIKI